MPRSSRVSFHGLPPAVWERLEAVLQRFEDAWRAGQRPNLADYLPADGPERRALLVELVHADLHYRLELGEATRAESYLAQYPELREDPPLALSLIVAEYDLRRQREPGLTTEEYRQRFPDLADAWSAPRSASRPNQDATMVHDGPGGVEGVTRSRASAPGPASASPGTTPPGYVLLGELGRGAMGVVYQAQDVQLKRIVAIKQLLVGGQASADQRARFRTEAEAVAKLAHPHIVQVYQAGEHDGQPFIVLEFVPGGSLHQQTAGRAQPVREAVKLVLLLARAVHAAHRAGVIHRDLKPGNVLLAPPADEPALNTFWGCPRITDFGLARLCDGAEGVSLSGTVLGTPSYMAPEQAEARAKAVGPHTDVWALGVMLYELLTGRLPFRADSVWGTIKQVCGEEPPPLRALRPEVQEALAAVVERCLQKKPEDRYPTVAALADDLKRWLDDGATGQAPAPRVTPARTVRRRRVLLGLAAALILLIAMAAGSWLLHGYFRGPATKQSGTGPSAGTPMPPDAGPAQQPFKGWIDILVSEPTNPDRQLLRLHHPRARPLRPGDQVHVEVLLEDRPGYAYVLWIDARGKVLPLYPWQDYDWTRRPAKEEPVRGKLQLPLGGYIYPIDPSPPGLETLLLLVRDEPLPKEEHNLAERLGDLGSQAWPDLHYVAWFENGAVVTKEPDRTPGKVGEPGNPAERTQLRVRQGLGALFGYSRAVVFGNRGVDG
jgi:hypothetical protein